MGNILSGTSTRETATILSDQAICESETMEDVIESGDKENNEDFHDTLSADDSRVKRKEEEMNEFMKQLTIKREQRKEILSRHRTEKKELEKSLEAEIKCKLELIERNRLLREMLIKNNIEIPNELQASKENSDVAKTILEMKEEVEKLKSNNNNLRSELASSNSALQSAYSDIADLSFQNTESIKQISSLKEVITVSKTMINLREQQLNELKNKLNEIEQSLADRETYVLSTDLRQEYERQLQNIRTLRGLYEERARLAEVTRQALTKELQEQKELNQTEVKKCKDLNAKIEELETTVSALEEAIEIKNNQIISCQDETRTLKAEMEVVNKLFSQVLLGYKNKQDLDKLLNRLEENHGILTQMAERENGSEASSVLPKLLLQLVSQVEDTEENKLTEISTTDVKAIEENKQEGEAEIRNLGNTSAEEIVQNLPKVWKVLMELLSHQTVPDTNNVGKITTCYKSVETKSGSVLVPSVSQTYIRLKDLIVEKLTLIKEVNRMKQLNGHLETRLQEQERRLSLVTTELSKTWHVVGRLRRHHHQLHTHEKILKYELQQKRKLLNELKEELEYCREKWEQAREKNTQSENDWKKLRAEFSSRKLKPISTSMNNSAESGYSDERPSEDSSESNDESEYVKEPQMRFKKKIKKSFQTVIDSSADFNLAAEREDPTSDMMDVTDLPLDNQEPESLEVSGCYDDERLRTEHEKANVETEDELGDILKDSCLEESSQVENYDNNNDNKLKKLGNVDKDNKSIIDDLDENKSTYEQTADMQTTIDPLKNFNNIKDQNERLIQKDKKIEKFERESPSSSKQNDEIVRGSYPNITEKNNSDECYLLTQLARGSQNVRKSHEKDAQTMQNTSEITKKDTLNTLKNPAFANDSLTSLVDSNKFKEILENIKRQNDHLSIKDLKLQNLENNTANVLNSLNSTIQKGNQITEKLETLHSEHNELKLHQQSGKPVMSYTKSMAQDKSEPSTSQVDSNKFKEILENIKRQDDHLSIKDQKLQDLENNTTDILNSLNSTIQKGNQITKKLETLHSEYNEFKNELQTEHPVMECTKSTAQDKSEPSTSIDLDHEAIFAARDLRLKRLEEQTKSLVNKVNRTATKGVKINYKLDELHNIYGSETSRAGTPSEDDEDNSQSSNHNKEDDNCN